LSKILLQLMVLSLILHIHQLICVSSMLMIFFPAPHSHWYVRCGQWPYSCHFLQISDSDSNSPFICFLKIRCYVCVLLYTLSSVPSASLSCAN
jgi:hypothetical protein